MFSGIVEEAAQVVALQSDKGNLHLTMKCSFVNELKIDQSVAHNGVCLTVVSMTEDTYTVTAIKETLERSNISSTRWRTVADQKNKVYYFESTLSPDIFWVDFKSLDFKAGTPIKKLTLTNGEIYAGNTTKDFKDSKPLPFLFGI